MLIDEALAIVASGQSLENCSLQGPLTLRSLCDGGACPGQWQQKGTRHGRGHGLTPKSVMMKALQQPSWSRSWYPKSLRRRGDVWDRLPRRLRQFRTVKGLLLTYMFAVFLPLQLTTMWGRQLPTLRWLLWGATLTGLTLMFALRRRALKHIHTRSGATAVEASALLNTPTWRLSTWWRAPASSLLRGQAQPPTRAGEASDPARTELADRGAAERPTQV